MFPSNEDQFGGASGNGGPPPADAMFESFLNDGLDDLESEPIVARESEIFSAGMHFLEGMRAMR